MEKSPAKEEPKPSPFAGFSFGAAPKPDAPVFGVQTVGTPTLGAVPTTIDYEKFVAEPSSSVLEQITGGLLLNQVLGKIRSFAKLLNYM